MAQALLEAQAQALATLEQAQAALELAPLDEQPPLDEQAQALYALKQAEAALEQAQAQAVQAVQAAQAVANGADAMVAGVLGVVDEFPQPAQPGSVAAERKAVDDAKKAFKQQRNPTLRKRFIEQFLNKRRIFNSVCTELISQRLKKRLISARSTVRDRRDRRAREQAREQAEREQAERELQRQEEAKRKTYQANREDAKSRCFNCNPYLSNCNTGGSKEYDCTCKYS